MDIYSDEFREKTKDLFIDHHNCMGMDTEEAADLFEDSPFNQVYKWLTKIGYNIDEYGGEM
ncbi:hypothetical protein RAH41_08275 [Gottfriedia acidiceleris]|uniref:hypothetical protein n=1 Tax=Gottfriedia acidiceleris TaxID=371036 RepID=UPI002F2619C9